MLSRIRTFTSLVVAVSACIGGDAAAQVPCKYGSVWAMPGSGLPPSASYLRVEGGEELQNPTAITLDLWLWIHAHHDARLLSKGAIVPSNLDRSYDVALRSDGRISARLFLSGPISIADVTLVSYLPVATHTWHRIVVTFDSAVGEARLHLDGLLTASATKDVLGFPLQGQHLRASPDPLYIGGTPDVPTANVLGAVDEVRVWTRALSPAEFPSTENAFVDGREGLAACFHLDDTFHDLTGGHVATKVGFGAFVGKCASFGHYGTGILGHFGIPHVWVNEAPVAGADLDLFMTNSTGKATPVLLVVGTQPAQVPAFGGTLLAQPQLPLTFTLPVTTLKIPFQVPAVDVVLYVQAFLPDAAAVQGVAATKGLFLNIGQ